MKIKSLGLVLLVVAGGVEPCGLRMFPAEDERRSGAARSTGAKDGGCA